MKIPQINTVPALDYSDVLIVPKYSTINSRDDVNLKTPIGPFVDRVPIIVANMDHTGTIEMAQAVEKFGLIVALHKHHTEEQLIDAFKTKLTQLHFITIGLNESALKEYENVCQNVGYSIPLIIDAANGYTKKFLEFVTFARYRNPEAYIIAGNVCNRSGIYKIAETNVNGAKIGIGPGGQCRTREVTGIGFPQFSAIDDCNWYNENFSKRCDLIADGGINEIGDFSKAFGIGADFVMAGSMFAGHTECAGTIDAGHMLFYGMASSHAMDKYGTKNRTSEGRVTSIPYKGDVEHTVKEILGGIASTMTYIGAKSIDEIYANANFVRVNNTINRKYESVMVGK